jgi:hypothetical protein
MKRFIMLLALAGGVNPAEAQVYGYVDEKGVLRLSNVPSDPRMRLVANTGLDRAGRSWRYNGEYDSMILRAAQQAGIDSALIMAVISVESGFNRFAVSPKGAMGLMQLMPATARRYGVANVYDPSQNISAGSRHLRDLLDEFADLRLALAAYNAGPEPVRRLGRIPPYRETIGYVQKVTSIYRGASRIAIAKGGKVYTIGPGGQARVASSTDANGIVQGGLNLPRREKPAPVEPAPTAAAASPEPSTPAASSDADPLYYRYRDPNGVIYITREKPATGQFEVLR